MGRLQEMANTAIATYHSVVSESNSEARWDVADSTATQRSHVRQVWDGRRPLLIGVSASIGVLILRSAGLLDGLWALGVAAVCFVFAPGPRRVSDRFLLYFAIGAGWLPLVGWVPGLGTTIDVPGVALAIGVGVVCGFQFRDRRSLTSTVALPTPAEVIALGAGGALMWWWALPFRRLSDGRILNVFFHGWDNDTHFAVFAANLKLGSFIQVRPTLVRGASRLGFDYPQGIHQSWAQFIRLLYPRRPPTNTWLIHSYLDVLLLTAGGAVVLGCMAVCRLARRDLLVALPAMATVVALFGLGSFGPFNGFPNFELSIAAAAVAVTLMDRPTMGPGTNFVAVAGLGLIVAYNWFPLLLLIAPAVVIAAVRARSGSHGRQRHVASAAICGVGVAYVLPLVSFAHRGVSFLNSSGGGISAPWISLGFCLIILTGAAVLRHSSHRDLVTNVIVGGPAVLGGGAVIAVAAYEAVSSGGVSYYGVKVAEGVFGVCLTVLACVFAGDLSRAKFRHVLSAPVVALAAIFLSAAMLQVNGYVGPAIGRLQNVKMAPGLVNHDAFAKASRPPRLAWQVIRAAQIARTALDTNRAEQWWYLDPIPLPLDSGYTNFGLLAEWFAILRGDPTNAEYYRGGLVLGAQFERVHSPSVAARIVIRDFPHPIVSHVHLFVPTWLRHAIVSEDPVWGRSNRLLSLPTPWTR